MNQDIISWRELLRAMRPGQWTKNLVVGAAYFFAVWDSGQRLDPLAALPRAVAAVVIFCVVSSGVYLFNDLLDVSADRVHPVKRFRPIAAGRLSPRFAALSAAVLSLGGLAFAAALSADFAGILGGYMALQAAYSLWLKRIALIDVLSIAAGFVLRAVSGAVAIGVDFSIWLLLCTFLLAMFLALCKRRHEQGLATGREEKGTADRYRADYNPRLLDYLIAGVSAATVAAYAMYTLSAATAEKFGTTRLGLTIPFVVLGMLRYLRLVYRHNGGGEPDKVLLTDRPLIITLILYAAAVTAILKLA